MISFKQVNIIYYTQISQTVYLSYCTFCRILQNNNKTCDIVSTNVHNSKSASWGVKWTYPNLESQDWIKFWNRKYEIRPNYAPSFPIVKLAVNTGTGRQSEYVISCSNQHQSCHILKDSPWMENKEEFKFHNDKVSFVSTSVTVYASIFVSVPLPVSASVSVSVSVSVFI